ncbi:hypothetical protein E2C01_091536 [Portunus trituberculatus]|uniref:Uncharacterized protein n=1 Tax=Portunus trituberculatus TaxID=210409 RepID=A0A5B7JVA6_PORTR|nr:hypothetical protein [Portunus trituberculatus]
MLLQKPARGGDDNPMGDGGGGGGALLLRRPRETLRGVIGVVEVSIDFASTASSSSSSSSNFATATAAAAAKPDHVGYAAANSRAKHQYYTPA